MKTPTLTAPQLAQVQARFGWKHFTRRSTVATFATSTPPNDGRSPLSYGTHSPASVTLTSLHTGIFVFLRSVAPNGLEPSPVAGTSCFSCILPHEASW